MTPRFTIPVLVTATALVLVGCGGSKNIVTVDGEAINIEDFNQYLSTKSTVRIMTQNGQPADAQVAETLGFQALQDLATRKIVMHMAADEGLAASEKDVEDEIKFKTALSPNYLTSLKNSGYTMGQIRQEVAYSLAQERLLTRGITVQMSEVDRIIKENPAQFMDPATITIAQIFVTSQDQKARVDAELKSSQPFKAVAAKYNKDPQGDELTLPIASSAISDDLRKIFEATPLGSSTDWIPFGTGFKKFYIEGRTEAKPIDMTPERKQYILRQIALNYGRQANDLFDRVLERLRSSDVIVSEDAQVLKDMWKRFEDRLDKISDTKTTTNPAGN